MKHFGDNCKCKGHPFNCYNHPNDCGCKNIEIKDCPVEVANDIWNAAIEEAAKLSDGNIKDSAIGFGNKIRSLKKC